MPADLEAIAREHETAAVSTVATGLHVTSSDDAVGQGFQGVEGVSRSAEERNELHPYAQTLSEADIDACTVLEAAAFPPEERATREKFAYRLKRCSEISLGLFTSSYGKSLLMADASLPTCTTGSSRIAVLIAHICSTRAHGDVVTDDDMRLPDADNPDPRHGHKEHGRTICLHSLAVLPELQGKGLGKLLMKEYLQRMASQNLADRVAIIAHDHLIPYYQRLGFENRGLSKAQFGGGGWYDMVHDLRSE